MSCCSEAERMGVRRVSVVERLCEKRKETEKKEEEGQRKQGLYRINSGAHHSTARLRGHDLFTRVYEHFAARYRPVSTDDVAGAAREGAAVQPGASPRCSHLLDVQACFDESARGPSLVASWPSARPCRQGA